MKKRMSNVFKLILASTTIVLCSLVLVSCPQSLSETSNLNMMSKNDPFESVRKTYMLSLMNKTGEEQLYFTDFSEGEELSFNSSKDWATASFNGDTVDLAELDVGCPLTEEIIARKTGIIPVITLKYEALDISLTTERSATILIDSEDVHIALMIFQGDELNGSSDAYFDPLSITRAGLGVPHETNQDSLHYNGNQSFSKETWRQSDTILIYTEIGDKEDFNGKKGYEDIPLPWNTDFSVANMPQNIIDETTPESGWELVMNMCGYNAASNINYFAVYNKYLGTLRVFAYTPELSDENDAKDQIWQVLMTNELAERICFSYGKPYNFTDISKLNAATGQTNRSEFSQLVSPWVRTYSTNGYIEPKEGWWCFDLDFSELRPNELNSEMSNLTFQIRSWGEQHTTLSDSVSSQLDEKLAAGINLDVNQQKFMSNSASGISGLASSITGRNAAVAERNSAGLPALVQSLFDTEEAPASPMEALVSLGSSGVGVNNMLSGATNDAGNNGGFLGGAVNLGISGSVDAQGLTMQSSIISEVPAPTINVSKFFDTEGTGFGEGVWAVENAPVVYYTENPFILMEKDAGQTESVSVIPKDGTKGSTPYSVYSGEQQQSGVGIMTFLDPESVKVKINSNIFPNPESVEVVSFITLASKNDVYGTMSKLRTGFGLNTTTDYSGDNLSIDTSRWQNNQYKDALTAVSMYRHTSPVDGILDLDWNHDETPIFLAGNYSDLTKALTVCGYMQQLNSSVTGFVDPIFCGVKHTDNRNGNTDDLRWIPNAIPDIAVNVCVIIKQDGNEYYYSRQYLPNLEQLDITSNLERWKDGMNTSHLEDGINYLNRPELYHKLIQAAGDGYTEKNDPDQLYIIINGTNRYRISSQNNNNDWYVEFKTDTPVSPKGYTLTANADAGRAKNQPQASWVLKAKAKADDNWTTIATVSNRKLPTERQKSADFDLDIAGGTWQYFRLEMSSEATTTQTDIALPQISDFSLR